MENSEIIIDQKEGKYDFPVSEAQASFIIGKVYELFAKGVPAVQLEVLMKGVGEPELQSNGIAKYRIPIDNMVNFLNYKDEHI